MDKRELKATINRAEKLGCGVLITEHDLSILKVNDKKGYLRTAITKIRPCADEDGKSKQEIWKPAFDQLTPALDALGLNLIYMDECAKLVYGEEEIPDTEFYYRSGEPERLANYLSTLYLEKSDGIDGTIKIRHRFWKDNINAAISRELDIFEAGAAKTKQDYLKFSGRLWCRMDDAQQQSCFKDFTGEDKERLMEIMAHLRD